MVRSCVSWCRHLLSALGILALLVCLMEIGLRVYDSATGQVTRAELYDRGMTCKSWSVHHGLKPSHTFSVRHPDHDERTRVAINSYGTRGGEPDLPRPANVFRIVCLGDELTLAAQTSDAETFCARLERELPAPSGQRVETLNAGVPDSCPLLSFLQWKHQLAGLQADLVILNLNPNDIWDDYHVRRHAVIGEGGLPISCAHPSLQWPAAPGAAAGAKRSVMSALLLPGWCRQRAMCLWSRQSAVHDSVTIESSRGRYLWLEDDPPDWSLHLRHALEPLRHLRDLVEAQGGRLVVAAAPAPWQVSRDATPVERVRQELGVAADAHYPSERPFALLAEHCRAQGLAFCDLSSAFRQSPEPEELFLRNAPLLSPAGHALYAGELARYLERELSDRPDSPGPGETLVDGFPELPDSAVPRR